MATGKPDDKGAAAMRAVLAGASIEDVSMMVGTSAAVFRRRLRKAFVDMFIDASKKGKAKGKGKGKGK